MISYGPLLKKVFVFMSSFREQLFQKGHIDILVIQAWNVLFPSQYSAGDGVPASLFSLLRLLNVFSLTLSVVNEMSTDKLLFFPLSVIFFLFLENFKLFSL